MRRIARVAGEAFDADQIEQPCEGCDEYDCVCDEPEEDEDDE